MHILYHFPVLLYSCTAVWNPKSVATLDMWSVLFILALCSVHQCVLVPWHSFPRSYLLFHRHSLALLVGRRLVYQNLMVIHVATHPQHRLEPQYVAS